MSEFSVKPIARKEQIILLNHSRKPVASAVIGHTKMRPQTWLDLEGHQQGMGLRAQRRRQGCLVALRHLLE